MTPPCVGGPTSNPVHYPADRRLRVWVAPRWLALFAGLALLPVVAAWAQYLAVGLPHFPPPPAQTPEARADPFGFPLWLRLTHYANFLFMILLIRSGLSILMDHPRLYWSDHCTPGTEWLRTTPLAVPTDRVWTAKEDARYLSPWIGLPGYRHTVGLARHWHFLTAQAWLLTGLTAAGLLAATGQWRRLTPDSWEGAADAWRVFVHYGTFHMPVEPNGFYRYNALQQVSYFATMFVMAPLSVLTGVAMSPAVDARFGWYPRLFGGRQCAPVAALPDGGRVCRVHRRPRNHGRAHRPASEHEPHRSRGRRCRSGRVDPRADRGRRGGRGVCGRTPPVVASSAGRPDRGPVGNVARPRVRPPPLRPPRPLPPGGRFTALLAQRQAAGRSRMEALAADGFRDYRLRVSGLVENPLDLSLADLAELGKQVQVTLHHCIQGWSGIAEWGGVPLPGSSSGCGPGRKPE